jgi:hypothetical protein
VREGPDCPFFRVSPLPEEAAGVRRWFAKDAMHFAEARPGDTCGCGWPEMKDGGAGPYEPDPSVTALADYLEELPAKRYIAELLLTFVGDEDERPSNWREISLAELRRTGFAFRRGEVLRVRSGVKD